MTSLFEKFGTKFGTAVDKLMNKAPFSSLADELNKLDSTLQNGIQTFTATGDKAKKPRAEMVKEDLKKRMEMNKEKKQKFSSCEDPKSVIEAVNCARTNTTSGFSAVDDSTTTVDPSVADDKQKIKELEAKTQEFIKKDTSLTWNGGEANRLRHVRWANQVVEPTTSTGPISYKDAILAQPMPVLSPLRGTNQPQGIRAIADANAGITTQYYDPKYALAAAIPANISSGSLDYTQKATIAGKENNSSTGQQAAGASSNFMAKFM